MDTTTERKCRKCGSKIPNWITKDGCKKNLRGRKFCLKCSPWGKHNTSPNDPIQRGAVRKTSAEYREIVTLSLYKRGLTRKCKLIEMSGGCCKKCGYNRSRRVLTFHHLDRETKTFPLTLNMLWSRSWEEIVGEWAKCQMLCMNCHAETEDEIIGLSIVDRVNAKYGTSF